mmetsp:Transcript_7174/g.25602  ORF Transcript_7174/g.25602 Transcript_7174/m.25602 type:complete len:236 (-) Transcript_7174:5320-6027(-)
MRAAASSALKPSSACLAMALNFAADDPPPETMRSAMSAAEGVCAVDLPRPAPAVSPGAAPPAPPRLRPRWRIGEDLVAGGARECGRVASEAPAMALQTLTVPSAPPVANTSACTCVPTPTPSAPAITSSYDGSPRGALAPSWPMTLHTIAPRWLCSSCIEVSEMRPEAPPPRTPSAPRPLLTTLPMSCIDSSTLPRSVSVPTSEMWSANAPQPSPPPSSSTSSGTPSMPRSCGSS